MTIFLGLGLAGVALLALSLLFGNLLEGLFDLGGLLDGWLSLPVVAGFVSMLGFTGTIVLGTTGLGAGAAAGWLTWKLSRALMRDQTAATPRGDDLVGAAGSVITAIPAQGYGEVLVRVAGQPVKLAAKSKVPVMRGTETWVEAALSSTSVAVRPVER
ncbi:hypothetical protein [Streptomyces chrestomyceticus]|uniref:hypothetical protein n=1 Tax=Streptomyces chrestomyceticus TaxID=68185 RepID=UPI003787B91A